MAIKSANTIWREYVIDGVSASGPQQPVKADIRELLTGAGFYAHKNGVDQTGMTHNAYTKVTFGTEKFDIGALFDTVNSRWTPPAGLVQLNVSIWWSANAQSTSSPTFVVKIIKNGSADVFAGIGTAMAGFPGSAIAQAAGEDLATGTDYYEAFAFGISSTAANNLQVDGNMAHTHFSGHLI